MTTHAPALQTHTAVELDHILIQGAREHNLRDVTTRIPKKRLVVFTGVSGSGKSSLAFDTLYAEGQRRYVESLSSYARQFLGQMEKPKYEHIRGLAPTISIEQKTASRNPRSTVGTITEILDYLRVLFARVGVQHCTSCGRTVEKQSAAEIVADILRLPEGTRFQLLAPIARNRKGEYKQVFAEALKAGFTRARVDGSVVELEKPPELSKKEKHNVELVVDRLVVKDDLAARLTDSVETALRHGEGLLIVERPGDGERLYSEHNACPHCHLSFPELEPQLFSFNTPVGMCTECTGLGSKKVPDLARIVPNPRLTIADGAIAPWATAMERESGWSFRYLDQALESLGVARDVPWADLPEEHRAIVLHGTSDEIVVKWQGKRSAGEWKTKFEGVLPSIERRYKTTDSNMMREHWEAFMRLHPCPACEGARLRPEARAVKVGPITLPDLCRQTIGQAFRTIDGLGLQGNRAAIAEELVKEIRNRLSFLHNVGLEYLSLDRQGPTLSGGESQRIRLAAQVGTELTGVIYILDEPSIGLHQRDNRRLLRTLEHLRDIGNTVVVVEHDQETIEAADWVLDFGPGAGHMGGQIVYQGPPAPLRDADTLTGQYLSGRLRIGTGRPRRAPSNGWLEVLGCRENNLCDIDVRLPAGCLVAITGVSGAGKSSLVNGTLSPALANHFHGARQVVGAHRELRGLDLFDKVIDIDQTPIGRTPRSNPATYTKAFDLIRDLFSGLKESKAFGYDKSRFSFNVKGGRCEACQGDGSLKVEMHFLADVYVPCEVCKGRRFNEATLRVKHRGKSIADVLEMTCDEALEHFAHQPALRRVVQTLVDVGLGYLSLGQSSTTLSGGEAQRIKLSRELARRDSGKTLYLLDEPTTGLHFDDVARLLKVLDRLVDGGNTVVVIEHNLDVVRAADWLVDLGPEGGSGGGQVVAVGTPEAVAGTPGSHTGTFLREMGVQPEAASVVEVPQERPETPGPVAAAAPTPTKKGRPRKG